MEWWAAKKKGGNAGEKKNAHLFEYRKSGHPQRKKSGREVGILRKSHFFPKNGHAQTQKTEYGRNIKHFLKWALKKKKVGEKLTHAHFLKVGIPKKKKTGGIFYVFLRKKKKPAHLSL